MSVTSLGFAFLPLCVLFAFSLGRLPQILILASAFSSAAVLVFGSYGLAPALIPLALFVGNVTLQLLLGVRYTGDREAWRTVSPFAAVAAWAVIGSIVLPRVFAGQLSVWPQKNEVPGLFIVPLQASAGNTTQSIYIVANCALLITSALYASRRGGNAFPVVQSFIVTGFAVVAISVWQFMSSVTGFPFPAEFFHSNPGWAQLSGQISGGVNRINGPFSEPAALAGYMFAMICAMGWMIVKGHRGWAIRLLLVLGVGTILLTTSTTGYAALTVVAIAVPLYALSRGSTLLVRRVISGGLALVLVGGLAGFTAVTFSPRVQTLAGNVLAETLDKRQSASYDMRSSADLDSLATIFPTYGFGVGWGSNRSSSLVPGLLSNLGVYGTLLVIWFGVGVARLVRRAAPVARSPADAQMIDCGMGYVLGTVLTALIAGPTIGAAEFYLILGVMIGTAARVVTQASARPVRRAIELMRSDATVG